MNAYFLRVLGVTKVCIRSAGKKILDAEFRGVEISITTEEEPEQQIGFEHSKKCKCHLNNPNNCPSPDRIMIGPSIFDMGPNFRSHSSLASGFLPSRMTRYDARSK
jgi:hypothetical protein